MNREQRMVIEWSIASLTQEPEVWRCGDYQCEHPNGTTVWIANDHYGMAVYANPERRGGCVGGVTMAGSLFGRMIPWRRRLRRAALLASRYGAIPPERTILAQIKAA